MPQPQVCALRGALLNMLISVHAGGPWPKGDGTPRAVSDEWYNKVCPEKGRVILNTGIVGVHLKDSDAKTLIDFWSKQLRDMKERCVEIDGREQIFNF